MTTSPDDLLAFWFGDDLDGAGAVAARCAIWFAGDAGFDAKIRTRFADLPERALHGELDGWEASARGTLALLIALDQLPRNLHRNASSAFACDARAREVAEAAIARGDDQRVHPLEAVFFYLPLEHAEDLAAQQRCVELCETLLERAPPATRSHYEGFLDYAKRHQAVIERFGRFPHRNETLGREDTQEERQYMRTGGETF
jgi:uncharacterized protein (DUF924 family)